MAEYIEREAAMTVPVLPKEYREYQTFNLDDAYEQGWDDALKNLENIPAADVAPVIRGAWNLLRHDKFSDVFQCSECGRKVSMTKGKDVVEQFPYCHCGAAMKMEDASCPEHQP